MELTALKVKIGTRPNGHADHPNFNTLPVVQASGMDWSKYIDTEGTGWNYDKVSGHADDEAGSPRGQQWGILFIPDAFAQEAVSMFPAQCSIIDETEATTFYEERAVAHLPDEESDERVINKLRDKLALMKEIGAKQADIDVVKVKIGKALDPNDPEPGIKKNWRKKFADVKARQGITIKPTI